MDNASASEVEAGQMFSQRLDSWRRQSVIATLDKVADTVGADRIVARMLELIQDADAEVCSWAAYIVSRLGTGAAIETVIERLLELIQDLDRNARLGVTESLDRFHASGIRILKGQSRQLTVLRVSG